MATLHYDEAWQKATNDTFKRRLRVALTDHCRYQIQRPRNVVEVEGVEDPELSESEARYAALQDLARVVLVQVRQPDWLTSAGLYLLLPWASFDEADDQALDARVAGTFAQLGSAAIVSP